MRVAKKHCPHCDKKIDYNNGRFFSNHVRWCQKNPKYQCTLEKTIQKIKSKAQEKTLQQYIINPVFCKNCAGCLALEEYKKERLYCSKAACRMASKNAVQSALTIKRKNPKPFVCTQCNIINFCNLHSRKKICDNCANMNRIKEKNAKLEQNYKKRLHACSLLSYRSFCRFSFNVYDFPHEFDLNLVEKFGWYKPTNGGNNLFGVSRDHIFSVRDGFLAKIDPKIVRHAANCRLLLQSDNVRKYSRSLITLDELHEKIKIWNEKYGAVAQSRASALQAEGCAIECVSSIRLKRKENI